jgi:hypothetical protein
MFILINLVLALILFISVVVVLVKKVLIGLKGTDSGVINLVLIVLGLIGIGCTLAIGLGISRIDGITTVLNTEKNISAKDIALLKKEMSETKNSNIISLFIGYSSLVIDYIVYKFIDKKNKQELLKEKNHWNLNKL